MRKTLESVRLWSRGGKKSERGSKPSLVTFKSVVVTPERRDEVSEETDHHLVGFSLVPPVGLLLAFAQVQGERLAEGRGDDGGRDFLSHGSSVRI